MVGVVFLFCLFVCFCFGDFFLYPQVIFGVNKEISW